MAPAAATWQGMPIGDRRPMEYCTLSSKESGTSEYDRMRQKVTASEQHQSSIREALERHQSSMGQQRNRTAAWKMNRGEEVEDDAWNPLPTYPFI